MKSGLFILLVLVAEIGGHAQPAETVEAMKRLHLLDGVWKGKGWTLVNGVKTAFNETETTTLKLNGICVQIEAFGLSADNPAKQIVNALALISYDQSSTKYLMRLTDFDGSTIDTYFRVKAIGSFEWGVEGKVRFTIDVRNNVWEEVGYKSEDGVKWEKTFEMRLEKSLGK